MRLCPDARQVFVSDLEIGQIDLFAQRDILVSFCRSERNCFGLRLFVPADERERRARVAVARARVDVVQICRVC